VPPDGVTVIVPDAAWQGILFTTALETVIVTPAQGFGAVSVKIAEPVQLFTSFAVTVNEPCPRLLNVPED
jgi:hypothetical protein